MAHCELTVCQKENIAIPKNTSCIKKCTSYYNKVKNKAYFRESELFNNFLMESLKTLHNLNNLSVSPADSTIYLRPKTVLTVQLAAIFILLCLNLLGLYLS